MSDIRRSRGGPSGRFVLRLDPALHGLLRDDASRAGLSLNEYCARRLAAQGITGPAAEVVRRATAICGDQVSGVVVFGSWARDQLADGSDVDVLIVVDGAATITRSLYTQWEAEMLDWDSRPVQAHFVRLPEPGARISGLWAEAAVEGVVLYDRELSLARRLVEIRRRIVAGEIVRREIHGQPYWVEAA